MSGMALFLQPGGGCGGSIKGLADFFQPVVIPPMIELSLSYRWRETLKGSMENSSSECQSPEGFGGGESWERARAFCQVSLPAWFYLLATR